VKTASTPRRPITKNCTRARARSLGVNTRRACIKTTAKRTSKPTCIYDNRRRLESCSRDPIGFEGSRWNLFEYVGSKPLRSIDPSGLIVVVDCHCYESTRTGNGPVVRRIEAADAQSAREACNQVCDSPCGVTVNPVSFDCSDGLENELRERCAIPCLLNGTGPWTTDSSAAIRAEADAFANSYYPPTPGDVNPVNNQALRHCFASARMACEFGSGCAECLMNSREDFQLECSGQRLRDTNRAKDNNNAGNNIGRQTCDPGQIKSKCLEAFSDGTLNTSPDVVGPSVN